MTNLAAYGSQSYAICKACGQQYGVVSKDTCFICEDKRQFVPSSGQQWTSLAEMRTQGYKNVLTPLPGTKDAWSISTTPKFAIGQRAILLCDSGEGNTLWDCITYLDEDTVKRIKDLGGLARICISHPHYYTTALDWARAFGCQVLIHEADRDWVPRSPTQEDVNAGQNYTFITTEVHHVTSTLTFCQIGGHFDGSAVLHSSADGGALFVGDTLSLTPGNRRITIMWSYPNMVPLDAWTVSNVCWPRLAKWRYECIYSKFVGEDLLAGGDALVKESLKFYCEMLKGDSSAFKELAEPQN